MKLEVESIGQPQPKPMQTTPVPALKREWIRISDMEVVFGIRVTRARELIKNNKIRVAKLKDPGKKFGVVLINVQSVQDYLNSLVPTES